MSVNKVILIGNVGKDPETRHLEGGNVVSKFSLATSEVYKNKVGEKITNTEWHNIVLWKGLAEIAEKYVRKGMQLYIEGRIRSRSYTDQEGVTKYTTEIIADSMQMLGKKAEGQSTPEHHTSPAGNQDIPKPANPNNGTSDPIEDLTQGQNEVDDLPF
jgi:single-strand DNA-binding protein